VSFDPPSNGLGAPPRERIRKHRVGLEGLSLVRREGAYVSVAAQRLSDFAADWFGRLQDGRRAQ
jgi:hypothetical protein